VPTNGRLDQQRYRYALWRPSPLAKSKLAPAEAATQLARRFFRWTPPATLAEFQWFSGLGARAARAAIEPLGLVAVEKGGDRLMLSEDLEAFESFRTAKEPSYSLVSSIDALFMLRRDVASFVDAKDRRRRVFDDKAMVSLIGVKDLPSHAILDRGRLVGLWEYDAASASIVWQAWVKDGALGEAVARTERYVREDLGDARSFSLDTPKSRAPRIAALRKK
jgi:hypothetical protein